MLRRTVILGIRRSLRLQNLSAAQAPDIFVIVRALRPASPASPASPRGVQRGVQRGEQRGVQRGEQAQGKLRRELLTSAFSLVRRINYN